MRLLLTATFAALMLCLPAFAQDSAERSDSGPLPGYTGYDFSDFGFYIDLPDGGYLTDQYSEGWSEQEGTAFVWEPTGEYPLWRIDMQAITFDFELLEENFEQFVTSMADEFGNLETSTLLDRSKVYDDDLFLWSILDVEHSGPNGTTYSRSYVTYDFDTVYVASFFSEQPPGGELQAIAEGVFHGFIPSIYVDMGMAEPLNFTSPVHSFSISLPGSGYYLTPGSEGWNESPEVEAVWYSSNADVVDTITVATFNGDADYTRDDVNAVLNAYVETMVGDQPDKVQVLQDKEGYKAAGLDWNFIEILDNADPAAPVYMTMFLTPDGTRLHAVFATHFGPLGDAEQNFIYPVLNSLSLP